MGTSRRELTSIVPKLLEELLNFEEWSVKWRFNVSLGKTNINVVTRGKNGANVSLNLYGKESEGFKHFYIS